MKRTTVYFPDEMKSGIESEATHLRVTEAEVIRRAVGLLLTQSRDRRSLNLPLFAEGLGRDLASPASDGPTGGPNPHDL